MSTTNWYVSTNGSSWTTCATAGIVKPRLTLRANGMDELLWQMDGDCKAAYAYAYGSTIYLARGVTTGSSTVYTIRFIGTVVSLPRTASGVTETIQYKAQGGWWWLEQITYQQAWQMLDQTSHTLAGKVLPRVVLGQDTAGASRSMGAEVTAAIAWAIAKGAPIASGTIDALATMPFSEQNNIPVAEVVRQAVRLQPDTIGWFDYSSGTPTFNFRSASSLSAVDVAMMGSGNAVDQVTLTPRYDLQLPGITINYETTFSLNGQSYIALDTETAGTPTDARAPAVIFPLQGVQADVAQQTVVVKAYPVSLNDTAFWSGLLPWLASATSVTITSGARSGSQALANQLVDGTVAPWMNIATERETFTCLVSYTTTDGSGNVREVVSNRAISVPVTSVATGSPSSSSTSGGLTTNTYQATLSYTAAEPKPTGLAAALYASWARLHWDGSFRLVEQEASFPVGPWCLVNLTGGLTAWASMAALIPEVSVDIEAGATSVTCGTFGRLQADSLVAFWRGIHHYRFAFHSAARTTGAGASGSLVQGGNNVARLSTCEGDSGQPQRIVLRAQSAESLLQTIDLNPAAVAHAVSGDRTNRTLAPQEAYITVVNPSTGVRSLQKLQLMGTVPYGSAIPLVNSSIASYDVLGVLGIGPESLDSTSWTVGSGKGVALNIDTRNRYYAAGLKQWFAYIRTIMWDQNGMLAAISGEFRQLVETPELP